MALFAYQGSGEDTEDTIGHTMDACRGGYQDEFSTGEQNGQASNSGIGGSSKTKKPSEKKRQRETEFETIRQFVFLNPTTPIEKITAHPKWLMNEYLREYRADSNVVKRVLDWYGSILCNYTIEDYEAMYATPGCEPTFTAYIEKLYDKYYNVDDSVSLLSTLLLYQHYLPDGCLDHFNLECIEDIECLDCQDTYERVREFLIFLYRLVDRQIPKCNCIIVVSPPSAGKNFFFDCVIHYFLNYGQLTTVNRNNTFAFQDAFNRRINVWNEPNFESAKIDFLKMLTAGDDLKVSVKCKSEQPINRTPLIMLSNTAISLSYDPAFDDRLRTFTWRAAPFLKEYTKKPNPLAFPILLEKWKAKVKYVEESSKINFNSFLYSIVSSITGAVEFTLALLTQGALGSSEAGLRLETVTVLVVEVRATVGQVGVAGTVAGK